MLHEKFISDQNFNRIDLLITDQYVTFRFFAVDHKPNVKPDLPEGYDEQDQPFDHEAYLVALEEKGWIVRRWAGGARAFKGKMFPIRSAGQIMAIRQRLEDETRRNHGENHLGNSRAFDLAYDL